MSTLPALRGVLDRARTESVDTTDLGNRFERLARAALTAHDGPQGSQRWQQVWSWGEDWPGKTRFDTVDTGIDLVARAHDGTLAAIQCKFYKGRIATADVDSFLAASSRAEFSSRIIMHTGTGFQHHGAVKLRQAHPICEDYGLAELGRWQIDWWQLAEANHVVGPGAKRRKLHDGGLRGMTAWSLSVWSRTWTTYRDWVARAWAATAAAEPPWQRLLLRAWVAFQAMLVGAVIAAVVFAVLAAVAAVIAVVALLFVAVTLAASSGRGRRRRRRPW